MKRLPLKPLLATAALLLQACGGAASTLFRGDRVTIDRDFIYLDDPVFLQSKSVYGQRMKGWFSFQLPIYFNADKHDTLRFGPGGVTVEAAAPESAVADSVHPAGRQRTACLVDTGEAMRDPDAVQQLLSDSNWTLALSPRREGPTKIDLNFYCREYDPPWGRTDTLTLAFRKKTARRNIRTCGFGCRSM
jgi:hypothetical protein